MLAVPSSSTNTANTVTSLAVTKPTGLAVGDLMLGHFKIGALGRTITLPTGFTQLQTDETATSGTQISYKIAVSADVSATDFTFSVSGANTNLRAAIVRITGVGSVNTITASSTQDNGSGTTVTAPTVTPSAASSLIGFFASSDNNTTCASYAIATSSPTFTEVYEQANSSIGLISFAYGIRPEITATGSGTATLGGASTNVGQLVVVSSSQDFSQADTVTCSDTHTLIRTLLMAVEEALTLTDTISLEPITRAWRNIAKTVSTWLNLDK